LIVVDLPKSAENSLFEIGDEIVKIGNDTPADIISRVRKYRAASNESALLRDAAEFARNVDSRILTRVDVVIRRNGELKNLEISRFYSGLRSETWTKENTTSYKLLSDEVGYIYPDNCKNSDQATIMEKFAETKAIIVDMRCYPMEFNTFEFIGDYFIPRKTHHVTWTPIVKGLPGYYQKTPSSMPLWAFNPWRVLVGRNRDYYKGMVVVLVDATTQSSAEYQTMSFQAAPNCIVVGSQTAGADGNVVELPMPHGVKTLFSGIGVYYPDGTNAQRVGVKIDHYVEPTIEGIKAGRDEVLEKALTIIDAKITEEPENL
jgi:C-terminal processing protease CtpA/Prc